MLKTCALNTQRLSRCLQPVLNKICCFTRQESKTESFSVTVMSLIDEAQTYDSNTLGLVM